ncbi:hypothetical protein D3C84_1137090 [compost metagenome]
MAGEVGAADWLLDRAGFGIGQSCAVLGANAAGDGCAPADDFDGAMSVSDGKDVFVHLVEIFYQLV